MTKISIVLLYLRIIPPSLSAHFKWLCYAIMAAMSLYAISYIILLGFQCHPISYTWLQWDEEHSGTCMNAQAMIYSAAALNILWDFIVFFLPMHKLLKLQVRDVRKKVMVILTFLVGLFGTVCSIVRLQYLTQWGKTANATMHYNDIAIWSSIEGTIGVICACMPAIAGPLMHIFRHRILPWLSTSKTKHLDSLDTTQSCGSAPARSNGIAKTVTISTYTAPADNSNADDVELVSKWNSGFPDTDQYETFDPDRQQYTAA
jgi:hypothetical protein